MKQFSVVALVASGLLLATAMAADEVKLDGVKCIVAGTKAANASKSVGYKGAKVYFCCDNCPKAYEKDKAKFASKANSQLVATGQAKQEKCPFSGGDLDKDTQITVNGAKVSFCCGECKGKAEKAKGDEQIDLVFGDKAFEKGFKITKK